MDASWSRGTDELCSGEDEVVAPHEEKRRRHMCGTVRYRMHTANARVASGQALAAIVAQLLPGGTLRRT